MKKRTTKEADIKIFSYLFFVDSDDGIHTLTLGERDVRVISTTSNVHDKNNRSKNRRTTKMTKKRKKRRSEAEEEMITTA